MNRGRRARIAGLLFLLWAASLSGLPATGDSSNTLPTALSDGEFWRLIEEFSEPNGYFRSDNLLSNEVSFQHVIPELLERVGEGGVYMGVGPEQNFTYISALKPGMVFITDIRRGNLHLHLMYKAIFELSPDRLEFLSRLFCKMRPEGLDPESTVQEIFDALWNVQTIDENAFRENLETLQGHLTQKRGLPLSKEDLEGIEYVYRNFREYGPGITYTSSAQRFGWNRGSYASYADLMTQSDRNGVSRSYLASEQNYRIVRELQQKNLVIPVVADFAGPKAIRAVGEYLKGTGGTVRVFYLSNVEQYLDGVWHKFCANAASLPLVEESTFIRTARGSRGLAASLGFIRAETLGCALASNR